MYRLIGLSCRSAGDDDFLHAASLALLRREMRDDGKVPTYTVQITLLFAVPFRRQESSPIIQDRHAKTQVLQVV